MNTKIFKKIMLSATVLFGSIAVSSMSPARANAAELLNLPDPHNWSKSGFACDIVTMKTNLAECNSKASTSGYPYFYVIETAGMNECIGCFKATSPVDAQPLPAVSAEPTHSCYCQPKQEREGWRRVTGWIVFQVTTYPDGRTSTRRQDNGYYASAESCQSMIANDSDCR